jgi:hypothetical protein
MKKIIFTVLAICIVHLSFSQTVTITVDANQNKRAISPYIYGRNESFDHTTQFLKDAGLRFARTNGGNNASGYNWRKRLSIHPDWYNNVYVNDWDATAKNINDNFTDMQGMFAFQLLGRVASNTNNNFNDWAYNQSQYWSGVGQNLAGGGTPDPNGGSKALVDGNINLFSQVWPADSSVAILNYWFGTNGKGFNRNKFQYWSMDNEVDVWNGTHDWAMPTLISTSAFMDRYITLAKKAKALYPGIKLCGPVTTSEWQWYKWSNESIYINGRYYPWIEYFIKRLGDEYKATGIKLVDVIDIHNYPWYNNDVEALQGHRIYYDTNYDYPGSNGIKTSTGGWDNSLTKQYIFKRFNDWCNEHFGTNHGITVGLSEWSPGPNEPNYAAVIYASHLGTFANNGVELFSPWTWFTGMWETLHLFSRYAKEFSIQSTSSQENVVSAYSSVNANTDAMTIILVNRSTSNQQNVSVTVNNFPISGSYNTLALYNLPGNETFVSHTSNALKAGTVSASNNVFTATLPPLSVTAVLLNKSCTPTTITPYVQVDGGSWQQTSSVTVNSGATVKFGPQPVSGGSWSWTGCGTSGTSREQTFTATSSCIATATYTNSSGCQSTQIFTVNVNGSTSGNYVRLTKSNASGYSIDGGNGGANGQQIYLWANDASNVNQTWIEIDRGGGYYSYQKLNTNYCMDGGNGGANGQSVYLWACDANNQNQQWQKISAGSNFRLQKRNASSYSIDGGNGGANSQILYLWASDANNQNQQWIFSASSLKSASTTRDVKSSLSTEIQAYPNPVVDVLHISGYSGLVKVEILDINGRLIRSIRSSEERIDINVSNLISGLYIVRVLGDVNSNKTIKFLKR